MEAKEYLKKYAYVYCYVISLCLLLAAGIRGVVAEVDSRQEFSNTPVLIIDAGHGGMDGGATSCTGVLESTVNLEIAQRLEQLIHLFGGKTVMTRTGPDSLATEGDTIREQKRSDLRNRLAMVRRYEQAILVSIHQNQFPDPKYWGPQVFYAPTEGSRELGEAVQAAMNEQLAHGNRRQCKPSQGVYLMTHIESPGILVECGFLSNPQEEALLRSRDYQQKLCAVLAQALCRQLEQRTSA